MQMACPGSVEKPGLRSRIIAIDCRAVHIAFGKADEFAALQVDCGENDHGFHSRNLLSRSSP